MMVSLSNVSIPVSNCSYNSYFKNSVSRVMQGGCCFSICWTGFWMRLGRRPLQRYVNVSTRATFADSTNPNRSSRRLDNPPFTRPKNSKKSPGKPIQKSDGRKFWEKQKTYEWDWLRTDFPTSASPFADRCGAGVISVQV